MGEIHKKISSSWRLAGILEDFKGILGNNINIIPSHVKREANGVANYLANEGVQRGMEQIIWDARTSEASAISQQCQLLASKDFPPPDGVPRRQEGHVVA
jgi:hypothetical protein